MKNKNNNGDRGSPCLTPFLLSKKSESEPLTRTQDFTELYIVLNILTIFNEAPLLINLNHIPFLYTISNAFLKSINAR